jgi:hypothetical protein
MKPSTVDILAAIGVAVSGDWPDPGNWFGDPLWGCLLYDAADKCVGDGDGRSAGKALAFAWLSVWAPDGLWKAEINPGSVPFNIPNDGRFELMPPGWDEEDCYGFSGLSF